MAKFQVTIKRVITTKITVDAETASAAAKKITDYGISEAAVDMGRADDTSEKIHRVDRI